MGETGVTQSQVGEWLGLSQAAVAKRISTRAVVFNVDELEAIAEHFFGVPVASLFEQPRATTPFQGRVSNRSRRAVNGQYSDLKPVTVIPLPWVA